jgi:glycosyltransferase involved in cell wall biosynthesis
MVDATTVPADRGGVGRYVDGLLEALGEAGADLVVACQRSDAERYARLVPSAEIVPGPTAIAHRPARLAWEQTGLPLVAQHVNAEVIHSPYYTMPLRAGRPVVVTLHDVTVFTGPSHYPALRGTFVRSATRTAVHRATRCIVPSQATRSELVQLLGADETKIDVAHHGVDHVFFHPPSEHERRRVRERLALGERPYVAFLGQTEPRRNVANLVRGWKRAVADLPEPPALVVAGASGWDEEVDTAVAEVPKHLSVIRPGYLRAADLAGFLGGAVVVAYPSYGEGFGFPVLEAMACGAAVLTTPLQSLPEVGGDAVAYTEPDAESIAVALAELLADEPRRAALGEAAEQRSREFTWEHSAQDHLKTYARAVAEAEA